MNQHLGMRISGFAAARARPRAFTLMEVLLALGIMSVVAVALFTSLHVAFKSKRTAEAVLEPVRAGETVMELIRADLESALPPRGKLVGAFVGRDWASGDGGDDDDVSFYSVAEPPPGAVRFGDVTRVELTVVNLSGTNERALARRVIGNLLSPTAIDPDNEILCRGVRGLNFRYYDGTQWWSSWDSTLENDTLPLAVEVTLELDSPTGRLDAGAPRGPRLMRVVQLACVGEGDPSEQPLVPPEGAEGEAPQGRTDRGVGLFGRPALAYGRTSAIWGDHR